MKEHFHFIGIGGIGMSALARILLKKGYTVSGSDVAPSPLVDALVQAGAKVKLGHSPEAIVRGSTVVYNSMIAKENSEFIQAQKLGCHLVHRSAILALIGKEYKTLAVTGTHGKTTTASLLTSTLKAAKLGPTFALGGILLEEGTNGECGSGPYFVIEADESDGSFLDYPVYGAIVTNIDKDHLDHFGTFENLRASFKRFMEGVSSKEHLFFCKDDPSLLRIAEEGVSYGFRSHAQWIGIHYRQEGWNCVFDIRHGSKEYRQVELGLVGMHMAANALAVFAMATTLGIEESVIRRAFKYFLGVSRRCEKKCEANSVLILDDYAHHPTEIKTTLEGIRRAIGKKRLLAVFQPHRYSRTNACLNDYKDVFNAADELVVTDIYGAFEKPIEGLTGEVVLSKIKESCSLKCSYIPKAELKESLIHKIRPEDVVVTLNAGDLTKISHEVGAYFKENRPT